MIALSIVGLAALIVIIVVLFINLSPQFGGKPTGKLKEKYATTDHYQQGTFINPIPTNMDMGFMETLGVAYEFLKGGENREPKSILPVLHIDSTAVAQKTDSTTRITWFGHSAFLVEIGTKNILIDPMFGNSPSPMAFMGPKRFSDGLPLAVEKIPTIDAVIYSHDHYDHLDYESVIALKDRVMQWYVPLGVGAHLTAWGVDEEKIHELDWWQEIEYEDLVFVCTPARHFSGRGVTDRFSTLWSSWAILNGDEKIFFSGDSGFGSHFKTIGDKYGPFDFAMMECGQYNEKWHDIHMMPEETAQAALDVQAKLMMPIHWGSFRLAFHSWDDPIKRVMKKAAELNMPLATPQIGEPIIVNAPEYPQSKWWEEVN